MKKVQELTRNVTMDERDTSGKTLVMKRMLMNPKATQPMYESFQFSQANRVGDSIWVSGQVGIDDRLTAASGMLGRHASTFESLKRTLAAAGATLKDVVELTTFHIDLRGKMGQFTKVKDECLPRNYPAWTAVGMTQLALPELRLEIRAAGSSKDCFQNHIGERR
jgi:enamine deaminase RidA (YjgF/YER057c/UK114 family)